MSRLPNTSTVPGRSSAIRTLLPLPSTSSGSLATSGNASTSGQQRGIVQFQQLRGAGLHVEGIQRLQRRIAVSVQRSGRCRRWYP